jgi:hypothetical protein
MDMFQDLYGRDVRESKDVTWDEVPLLATLLQSIYGGAKLIFGKVETKEFPSVLEAEKWADENNTKIKIRHNIKQS